MADNAAKPGFLKRAGQAVRYTVSGITPQTWFSPLQPIKPFEPVTPARQYDYNVGRNVFYTPGGEKRYSFMELRNLARYSELVRLAIETRLDQLDAVDWFIQSREDSDSDNDDPRIKQITEFFQKPDKIHDWSQWLRMIGEEIFVTDALSIHRQKNKGNTLYALNIIDGTTIFPVIDGNGMQPLPPDPAYQQILKGVPKNDFTSDELIYAVKKTQVNTPYGWPIIEQIVQSCKTDIERTKYQLAYFTDGSVPDAYITAPDGMTADKVKIFEENLNALLSGNWAGRRQMPVLLHGMKVDQLKEPPLMTEFDEWFWRKIAYAFSLPPTPLVKMNNRATAENQKQAASEEGLLPYMRHIKRLIDKFIREDFEAPDLEFAWDDEEERDPLQNMQINTGYVDKGVMAINEVRKGLGLEGIPGGDLPMLATPNGFIPVDPEAAAQLKIKTQQALQPPEPKEPEGQPNNQNAKPNSKTPPVKKKPAAKSNMYAIH